MNRSAFLYFINKFAVFLALLLPIITTIHCTGSSESDLDKVIAKYEKLYQDCGNPKTKHKFFCFKIYTTLASLYYAKEFIPYKKASQEFTSAHPVKYDSLFFVDHQKKQFPQFEKTLRIYGEIINQWGEGKLSLKNQKMFANALYFSEDYSGALPEIIKILSNKLPGIERETFELMQYDCYLSMGIYDTAEILIKKFLTSCTNREYLKYSQLTLDNMENIKKYSRPRSGENIERWPKIEPMQPDPRIEQRIASLLRTMSLDRKIGQMIQIEIRSFTPDDMKKYRFGSVLNGGGSWPHNNKHAPASEWVALADSIWYSCVDGLDTPIPPIWGTDAVHGHNNVAGATIFPHNIGLGAAHDTMLVRRIGQVTAKEVAATGLDWDFAPTVAVARDDRWGRTYESYSEQPELVAANARNYIAGLQGTLGNGSVLATAKHYIGDGGTDNGDDRGNNRASEVDLIAIHAPGYLAALKTGVQVIMASYSSWQGTEMHVHTYLLTAILKNRLGFDGFVITDWNGIENVRGCSINSCPSAVNAGIDVFMIPFKMDWQPFIDHLKQQVESGEVPMTRIDDAVARILRVKLRMGLFDRQPPGKRTTAKTRHLLGTPEHRSLAREAVRKSLVLLKNNNNTLPIDRQARILVTGCGADSIALQSGGWSITWQGTENTNRDFVNATSILRGITSTAKRVTYDPAGKYIHTGDYDFAIIVIGERPYAEYQGDIEGGLTLEHAHNHPKDLALLQKVKAAHIPVVTIFLSGRPMCVNRELNCSDAFIAAWLPGSEGEGIADLLFKSDTGKTAYDFTGTLSFSWPKRPCQSRLNKGDNAYDPLFPSGYGLSYSTPDTIIDSVPEYSVEGYGCNGVNSRSVSLDSSITIFNGNFADSTAPWMGGPGNWDGQSGLPHASIPNLTVSMASDMNGNTNCALQFRFKGPAYWGINSKESDLAGYFLADYALSFAVCVKNKPAGTVIISLLCHYPCQGNVDITGKLHDLPVGTWNTIRIPLKEFMRANFLKIDSQFQISTTGAADLLVADIRWEKGI